MGNVVSRWKAKPSTVDVLETIDKDIKDLEEFREKNERLRKLWVGRLLLYSSVLYLFTCLSVYLCFFPDQWTEKLLLALPLALFPVLVWFMRKLLIYLFAKRTERNNEKLGDLRTQKKKILEEVMEKETYKNAKLILERFDPESKKKDLESSPVGPQMTPRPGQELRHRTLSQRPPGLATPVGAPRPPLAPGTTPSGAPLHSAPGGPPERMGTPHSPMRRPLSPATPIPGLGMHPPGPPLARPILPRERGAVDRVIEYLVGDGPQNRYALICQQCLSHNGMALKEEFEYIAFRCAYCYFLNPARKTRPQAPRLPEFSFERRQCSESPTLAPSTASEDEEPVSATDEPREEPSRSESPCSEPPHSESPAPVADLPADETGSVDEPPGEECSGTADSEEQEEELRPLGSEEEQKVSQTEVE
ncbi:hypothetical protein COCON_G00197380 [Conger conger]|uniref:Endoplasmic reticulum junction formation protein lunapark n=1 Tax=Conger conger TaxID=82655 RepID=A0A9Q1HQX4_CONCO|nr:hypothetical protein COCON_G00197380 [Conger conger]